MPTPNRPCAAFGCPEIVPGGGFCAAHKPAQSAAVRGYDRDWQKLRALKLRQSPLCELRLKCSGAIATEVDHVRPFRNREDPLRLMWTNLQSACHPCHLAKTMMGRR